MGPADLEALLKKKPIPYVRGPGKQIYIVDHHHLARALWSLKDSRGDSWRSTRGLVRQGDQGILALDGVASTIAGPSTPKAIARPYAAIPTSIADLTDNIWRTLGRGLRGKAFEDLDTPYQEFMWGDYFRTFAEPTSDRA